ncbi:hypothetical protein CHLRE_03g154050v5 [Chlamydomonas reinhardtii]|uniref:Fungal lipase-like domain-containing protein n=1 Tax=Chlamydomonas reinhardtii TaxID=3055 RepID=A0A2K3DVX8_CHLRE|nr:uncharacterized protein CHLRE_03g154050v5 [Chlamydomonas reinhardtii]PNW84672.1 hypothetical protein CHLRE_03g154050v5 [Chlamydomonas reinhardtii]
MFDVFSAIGNAIADITQDAVKAVGHVTASVGDATAAIGHATGLNQAMGLLYTKGLSGQRQELLKLLVAASANVYEHANDQGYKYDETRFLGNRLRRTDEGSKGSGYGFVRYAVYQVASGPYAGKTILAYEGTFSSDQKWQDFKLMLGNFKATANTAESIYHQVRPDFITGHSLGGCIAEVVCSRTGCRGAAFNAPGPWSPVAELNVVDGDKYNDVEFEIHLAVADPVVSLANSSSGGRGHGHIGNENSGAVHWHEGAGVLGTHGIDCMVAAIGPL